MHVCVVLLLLLLLLCQRTILSGASRSLARFIVPRISFVHPLESTAMPCMSIEATTTYIHIFHTCYAIP